jgi:hypothetical protein
MFNSSEGFGIFAGAGVEEHYKVKQHPHTVEGANFEVTCDNCGRVNVVTLEWQQIADAAAAPHTQRLPRDPVTQLDWKISGGRMFPQIGCVQCRHLIGPSLTPDEANRLFREAQLAGLVRTR